MTFTTDLEFGEKYEIELLKYLDYEKFKKPKGNFKPYDIKIYKDGKKIKYEVKADKLTYKTGNIAIEYQCNNKLSGIATTKAKYWAYFIIKDDESYDLFIIPKSVIEKSIENKEYKRIVSGGDGYRARLYLFDMDLFKNYSINV